MARNLTHEQPTRREDPAKVGEIGPDGAPGRQMLQHEHAVDQVEVIVREHPKVGMFVDHELAIRERRVQLPGGGGRTRSIGAFARGGDVHGVPLGGRYRSRT